MKMLLLGIGNSGRGDDGLGWKFVECVEKFCYKFIEFEFRYQLHIEDADTIGNYEVVVFVDASHEKIENGFQVSSCKPSDHYYYSTHAQDPGAILHLCNNLFNKFPKAYLVAIAGEEWDLGSSLSKTAMQNLKEALSFFTYDFLPAFAPKMNYA